LRVARRVAAHSRGRPRGDRQLLFEHMASAVRTANRQDAQPPKRRALTRPP